VAERWRRAPWTAAGFWPWLLGALFLSRLAGLVFGVVDLDEDEFCVIGGMIARGAISYAGVAEFKPPLTHLAFLPASLLGGVSIAPMRVLGALWLLATCLVLAHAAQEWTGDAGAGRAAAFLALLAACCEVPAVNAELLMDLPLAGALLAFVHAERTGRLRHDLTVGLCVGIASLFKHQGAMMLVALGAARAWPSVSAPRPGAAPPRRRGRRAAAVLLLGLGFALPWGVAAAAFARAGHLADFFEWMVLRNLGYAGKASIFSLPRAALSTAVCLAGTAVPWALAARESFRGDRDPVRRGLALALWTTWIPVAVGGRFYEHYFLQFVPPLAVLGAPAAADLIRRWPSLPLRARATVVAVLASSTLGYLGFTMGRGLAGKYPNQDPKVREVAAWLVASTPPGATLFVWGHAPQIYYLSQRHPATRYLTAATQMGGFDPAHLPRGFDLGPHRSARDVERLLADLEATRADVFVDTAPADIHEWSKVPLAAFPELSRYVAAHYTLAAEPAGARVYRRR